MTGALVAAAVYVTAVVAALVVTGWPGTVPAAEGAVFGAALVAVAVTVWRDETRRNR